eukprot:ANDGO_04505.mRNA.1 hypothetical protein
MVNTFFIAGLFIPLPGEHPASVQTVEQVFETSFRHLDYQRLGKQRVEASQMIDVITKVAKGQTGVSWSRHPCTLSWSDNLTCLQAYYNCCIAEWVRRGYTNNMLPKALSSALCAPWWMGWVAFIYSHRAALVIKRPDYYFDNLMDGQLVRYLRRGYIWPSKLSEEDVQRYQADPPETTH